MLREELCLIAEYEICASDGTTVTDLTGSVKTIGFNPDGSGLYTKNLNCEITLAAPSGYVSTVQPHLSRPQ